MANDFAGGWINLGLLRGNLLGLQDSRWVEAILSAAPPTITDRHAGFSGRSS